MEVNCSDIFFNLIKLANKINYNILTKKIKSVLDIKKSYFFFIKSLNQNVKDDDLIIHNGEEVNLKKELLDEVEKLYSISLRIFKSHFWGEFYKLNQKEYPELYDMLIDKNGDIRRSFDNFNGSVAMMDFHGYTKFSNDVKYNKSPLKEFGETLPTKIDKICKTFRSIVYEIEGDALILIGPENPLFVINAVLSIMELARQKPFSKTANPKNTHGVEIKNPVIKPFEMNASIVTGGETFINDKGSIIGTIIAEASRMLKIINTKKPDISGIMISDRVFRNIEKFRSCKITSHLSIFDFKISETFLVDVKGIRLNMREVFLSNKVYLPEIEDFTKKLVDEIKKKTPSKWFNILVYYIRLIMTTISSIKISINVNGENLNSKKLELLLYRNLDDWLKEANPEIIRSILKITNELYCTIPEVKDVTAIFHEFIHENYSFIAEKLEYYFVDNLRIEENNSATLRKLIISYNSEMQKIKNRIFPRRIIETILSDISLNDKLYDVPYMGKK